MSRLFHIVTLFNQPAQYAGMRQSFEAAGFTGERARYTGYDNSAANLHDPYAILRGLADGGPEPYVVFCHQDVRLDLGHGYDQLAAQAAMLDARHRRWVVAGNAGVGNGDRVYVHLNQPAGAFREPNLPVNTRSLDENFLLLRRGGTRPFCSPGLQGFHLYATDVCLNAIARGGTAHIIDFLLTHLSDGNPDTPSFRAAMTQLTAFWNRFFLVAYVRTPCAEFSLTCSRIIRYLLYKRPVRTFFTKWLCNPLIRNPLCSP